MIRTRTRYPRLAVKLAAAAIVLSHWLTPVAAGTLEKTFSNFDTLVHYDTETGKRKTYTFGDNRFVGEPVFAPRNGSTQEADGYLVALVYDAPSNTSELAILDSQNIDQGPVATAKVPIRIPAGFHGSWLPAA